MRPAAEGPVRCRRRHGGFREDGGVESGAGGGRPRSAEGAARRAAAPSEPAAPAQLEGRRRRPAGGRRLPGGVLQRAAGRVPDGPGSGISSYCERYREGMKLVLNTFGSVPEFSGEIEQKINQAMSEKIPSVPKVLDARRKWRDDCLTGLAKLKTEMKSD